MGAAAGPGEPAHDPGAAPGEPDQPAHDPGETPDAVEQVQRALLTLIGAARVVLDAAEALVADRRRLDELAASGRHLVGTLRSAVVGPHEGQDAPAPADSPAPGDGDDKR